MKLNELCENNETPSDDFNNFLEDLKVNCSEYYNQQIPLYRGVHFKETFEVTPIRKDRKLRNSSIVQNTIFNHLFEKIHGIPLIRNQVAFITRKHSTTNLYGVPYYVFPDNSSNIIYNENVNDSMNAITIPPEIISYDDFDRIEKKAKQNPQDIKTIDDLFKIIEIMFDVQGQTKKDNIINALKQTLKHNEEVIREYKITKEIPSQKLMELMVYGDNLYIVKENYIGDFENFYKDGKEQQ